MSRCYYYLLDNELNQITFTGITYLYTHQLQTKKDTLATYKVVALT